MTQSERTSLSDGAMLDAAIHLIVTHGTDKTTLKAVGELAGYSRGLAGHRFGSKAGMLSFVVRSIGEKWLQKLTFVTKGKVGLDAIKTATDAHFRFCLEAPDYVCAFYILWFEAIGANSETKIIITGIHTHRQNDVKEWIEKGIKAGEINNDVDAKAIANQFCACITGLVYQWLIKPESINEIKAGYDDLKQTMERLLPKYNDKSWR